MQVKKILCIVITLCTLLTGIVPVTYAKEEEPKKVLLEDDFRKGMLNWGTMGAVISEGKMSFPSGWNKAELTPGSLWDANYTLECEFAETGDTGEWEGWNIGGIQFLTRQRLNSEIVYAYNGEGTVGKFKMKVGEHYNVKYVVKPESITVYMKGANETSYRREIGKVSVKLGRHAISFISYSIPTEIYHVKITANSSNGIDQKAMGINVDETEQITFGKGFDTSGLTYESSDTEIAEVSDNGTVTAKKQGTAVIKIKRGEKEVESVFVRSMNKLRSLSFKYDPYLDAHRTKESIEKYGDSVVIEAGETCDLELTCAPSDAFLNQLEWTVDNPEIVELYGLGESTRACTGLKEGKATIHVQARYADTSTNIDVVVLPKSAPAETTNYEFVWDGTKDQLSDYFWGMHIAAADTTLETDRGKSSAEILKKSTASRSVSIRTIC